MNTILVFRMFNLYFIVYSYFIILSYIHAYSCVRLYILYSTEYNVQGFVWHWVRATYEYMDIAVLRIVYYGLVEYIIYT